MSDMCPRAGLLHRGWPGSQRSGERGVDGSAERRSTSRCPHRRPEADAPRRERREREEMTYETILYEVEDRIATIRSTGLTAQCDQPEDGSGAGRRLSVWREGERRRLDDCGDRHRRAFCTGADVDTVREDGKILFDGRDLSRFVDWDPPRRRRRRFARWPSRSSGGSTASARCGPGSRHHLRHRHRAGTSKFFDPHVSIGLASGREMVRMARRCR